ncbi:putative transcription factor C2H2 family [Rosa chinensis]|uniref:Putative transcription factor C2H2 family n=1 Tax=Rosa chinensis TaxID=74649 RepID=A0A2P6RQP4_ROSCH|nr:putative transcription factor C2H2 family [Rosa chinensis]
MEATAAAYHIFLNVSLLGSKSIEEEDLMRFMTEEEVLKSSNRFAGKPVKVYNTRKRLIYSLTDTEKGVISLKRQSPVLKEEKDAVVGCEFSGLDLNLRHESVVISLYEGGLPRQCKSCGLRFKCEKQHSSHMDWHVKKNRMSKTRKQKPSRNLYATTSMWLVTDVEAETEALPSGVVLCVADTSGVAEKKRKTSDEEMVVPADEDQSKCALCTDAFVEFYSHEKDEWMYKGAVYLNAPQGPAPEMDRSQLGPIVHAKCWSEGSRKRLRRT